MSLGFEQAILGTVLKFPESINEIDITIMPADFVCVTHQMIWTKIASLNDGHQLSSIAIVEGFRHEGYLEQIGQDIGAVTGEEYFEFLFTKASSASVNHFAEQVVDASIKRSLDRDLSLAKVDLAEERPADEILDRAEARLYDLRRRKTSAGVEMEEILGILDTTITGYLDGSIKPAYVPKLEPFKRVVAFMEGKDFCVLGARPSDGKSSIMRYEAFASAQEGIPSLIVNMDNGEIEYARYLVAFLTGIDSFLIRDPRKLSAIQLRMVRDAIQTLKNTPIRIVTMGSPSATEVVGVMKRAMLDGYKMMFVDYVQQMRNPKFAGDDVGNISCSSSALRGFNMKYDIPVMVGSQFNREIVHRGVDAEPTMSDFKGSGALEQDATILTSVRKVEWGPEQLARFPENMEVINNRSQLVPSWRIRAVPVKLYVLKHRNGPTGSSSPFKWDKATNQYEMLEQ